MASGRATILVWENADGADVKLHNITLILVYIYLFFPIYIVRVSKASFATATAHEMPIHKWGPKTIIETDHACGNPLRSFGFAAGPSTAGEFVHRETESRSAPGR